MLEITVVVGHELSAIPIGGLSKLNISGLLNDGASSPSSYSVISSVFSSVTSSVTSEDSSSFLSFKACTELNSTTVKILFCIICSFYF